MAMRTCIYPNLAAEMARCGHTQTDVADMLGLKQSAISTRMAGRTDWTINEVTILCAKYGRDFGYLFKTGEMESATDSQRSIRDPKD